MCICTYCICTKISPKLRTEYAAHMLKGSLGAIAPHKRPIH